MTFTCTVCKVATKTEDVDALDHDWGEWAQTETTCNAIVWQRTCSRCPAVEKKTDSAEGHTPVTDAAVAATCTTTGLTEGSHCSVCGAVILAQTVVPALGHNMAAHEAIAKTCTTAGNSAYWFCDRCDKYFSDAEGEDEITENSWVIPASHTLTKTDAVAATCTEAGNIAYWTCSACHKYFSDEGTTEIAENAWITTPLGHELTAHPAKDATCTEDGVTTAYWSCSVCHKYFSDANGSAVMEANSWGVIPAKGHTLTKTEAKAATATAHGNSAYWTCSVCHKYFSNATGTTEIAKDSWIDHNWNNGEVTKEATATETGTKKYTCTVCQATKTEPIPKISSSGGGGGGVAATACEHTWNAGTETKKPTCTEAGVKTFTCTKCNETKTEAIAATGHSWGTATVTKEANCTEAGSKTSTCSKCNTTQTETIPALGHTPGDLQRDGSSHWRTCTRCGVRLDSSAHTLSWKNGSDGLLIGTCSCGYSETKKLVTEENNKVTAEIQGTPTQEEGATGGSTAFDSEVLQTILEAVQEGGEAELVIELGETTVVYDAKALEAIAEIASVAEHVEVSVAISAVKSFAEALNTAQQAVMEKETAGTQVFEINLRVSGVAIHNFAGGQATVTVPFEVPADWDLAKIQVYRLEESGEKTVMPTLYKDGKISWQTDGHSFYMVGQSETETVAPISVDASTGSGMSPFVLILIIVGSLLVLAGGAVLTVILIKKKKAGVKEDA